MYQLFLGLFFAIITFLKLFFRFLAIVLFLLEIIIFLQDILDLQIPVITADAILPVPIKPNFIINILPNILAFAHKLMTNLFEYTYLFHIK